MEQKFSIAAEPLVRSMQFSLDDFSEAV